MPHLSHKLLKCPLVGCLFMLNGLTSPLQAQPVIQLDSVEVSAPLSKMSVQMLYPDDSGLEESGIRGFYALEVYRDGISSEIWSSKTPCLTVSPFNDPNGTAGIALKWDKLAEGCPGWIGLGMGWDAWAPKNMAQVIHHAALKISLKALEGQPKNIPVAFALEDYSGAQCWLGFKAKYLSRPGLNNAEWNELILPLEDFEWERSQVQPSQIKQLIIQFEARGNMAIDEISWIPYSGNPPHSWQGTWNKEGGAPTTGINREASFLVGRSGRELLLLAPFDTLPAGTFTLSALPEQARIRRAGKHSDFVFHSQSDAVIKGLTSGDDGYLTGIPCLRIPLPPERHPGIIRNQAYFLSFQPDSQKTHQSLIWGTLKALEYAEP